jgi:hypothetical protein
MSALSDIGSGAAAGATIGSVFPGVGTAIGTVAGALLGGVRAFVTGRKKKKANQGFGGLMEQRPKYEIPKEYQEVIDQFNLAQARGMAGYGQMRSDIGQAGARSRGEAERTTISGVANAALQGQLLQKEIDAIQNLGIQQEQYKTGMLTNVAGAKMGFAGQKAEQWNQDKNIAWQQRMNQWTSENEAERTNEENSWETMLNSLGNLAGTKYYADMYKKLYPKGSTTNPLSPYGNLLAPNLFDPTKSIG